MKKINLYVEIILVIAIALLYVLFFTQKSHQGCLTTPANDSTMATAKMPIAYINIDSLLAEYEYSQELNDQLLRKRENSQANFNQKARQLEEEVAEFQRKYENNAFLSQQRMQSEQQRLIQKQQDLQTLDEKLSQELATELQRMNERLRDSIYLYLQIYNKEKGYHLIMSNTANDNIMIGNEAYNITEDIICGLNTRYKSTQKKSKK